MIISLILMVAFVNTLIIYAIQQDIKEYIEVQQLKQNKLDNLLNYTIDIDLSEKEQYMLEQLSKFDKCKNEQEFIRKILKEEIKNYEVI